MRIAVYGAGGVGGYFGGRLAQAGAEVHFIARGAHLQALRERGLRVRSVKGDFQVQVPATDDPAEVGPCDVVLFCVKTFDTDAAAARLGPLVGEDTAVVSLQNGVENEEKLARAVIEPDSFSSLHDDLVAGRRMELEGLHGFVVRRAEKHGLAVPTTQAIYAILRPWAIRNQRASTESA